MGNGSRALLLFSAYEVKAFPAIQEFAFSSGVMVGKRDCDGSVLVLVCPGFRSGCSSPCIG